MVNLSKKNPAIFFMRSELSGHIDKETILEEIKSVLPLKAGVRLSERTKKNIVIFATREYHCLGDLLMRHKFHDLYANIVGVVSNYDILKEITEKFDVPFFFANHMDKSREDHEAEMGKIVSGLTPDLIVLAKYMRILSPAFVQQYYNRIINIHHSFLPAFIGANPYQKAYERGVKIIGATAHFVTENVDEGLSLRRTLSP